MFCNESHKYSAYLMFHQDMPLRLHLMTFTINKRYAPKVAFNDIHNKQRIFIQSQQQNTKK